MEKKTLRAIVAIAIIIGAFGVTFGYFALSKPEAIIPIILMSSIPAPGEEQETGGPIILSGTYTGLNIWEKTVLVPEANTVTLIDGQFLGAAIYVFGNLNIINGTVDHLISPHDNCNVTIINSTIDIITSYQDKCNVTIINSYWNTEYLTVLGNSTLICDNIVLTSPYETLIIAVMDFATFTSKNNLWPSSMGIKLSAIYASNSSRTNIYSSLISRITLTNNANLTVRYDSEVDSLYMYSFSTAYLYNSSDSSSIDSIGIYDSAILTHNL